MFEVLMYLFENYMDSNVALAGSANTIAAELEQIGFTRHEIGSALSWLEGLILFQEAVRSDAQFAMHPMRHFSPEEGCRLGIKGRGFLLHLEQISVLDAMTREIVIDRLMALDRYYLDLGRIKWVVVMALYNQPDKKYALSVLKDMMLSDELGVLH